MTTLERKCRELVREMEASQWRYMWRHCIDRLNAILPKLQKKKKRRKEKEAR